MAKSPKGKDQDMDKRRDELAKIVLKTPPQPKHGKPIPKKEKSAK